MTNHLPGPLRGGPARRVAALIVLLILAVAVALPTLAADPSPSPAAGPGKKPDKVKTPAVEVTLRGVVLAVTDAAGTTVYTIASGGTTYQLDAGPAWFHGDRHPLKPHVGKTVTVVAERRDGSTEVDVVSVNGERLRAAGKPPWAGGWKRVGKAHPGWTQEKADRWAARMKAKADKSQAKWGDCFPPGQCKPKPKPTPTPAP